MTIKVTPKIKSQIENFSLKNPTPYLNLMHELRFLIIRFDKYVH